MFGYVLPAEKRLDEADKRRFRAAYCGLCHTLGRRYGFAARFTLNYDFTLLAILLSGEEETAVRCRRCAVHPCRGCEAAEPSPPFERAADKSLILTWWQLRDHIADSGFFAGLKYRLAALVLRRACGKARRRDCAYDELVRQKLEELGALERAGCDSLDRAAEPFAALLAAAADDVADGRRRRILGQLFYHLGRWIYLVDAADDFADDERSGAYNPLRFRYGAFGEEEKQALALTLDASVREMAAAYALCGCGPWSGILDSIFYDSLYGIGSAVLRGTYRAAPRLYFRRGRKKREDTV